MKRKAEDKQKKFEQQTRKASSSQAARPHGKGRPPPVQKFSLAKRSTLTTELSVSNEQGRRAIKRRTRSAKQITAVPDDGENATQVDNGRSRLANDNEEIDPNTSCMCFISFEDDALDGCGYLVFVV